jgi:hypothetical protein
MESNSLFRLLMAPSNAVCDALRVSDENERGMVRMLVNTLLWMTVGCTVLTIIWVGFG